MIKTEQQLQLFTPYTIYDLEHIYRYNGCFTAKNYNGPEIHFLFRTYTYGSLLNILVILKDDVFMVKNSQIEIVIEDMSSEEKQNIIKKALFDEYIDIKDCHDRRTKFINHKTSLSYEINRLSRTINYRKIYYDILHNQANWNYVSICCWYKDAGDLINSEPTISFFKSEEHVYEFHDDDSKRLFLELHYCIPDCTKKYFTSAKQAYRQAKELFDSGKKNKFGYTVLADDGHICNSLAEAKIDNYLSRNNIHHEKEPLYPGGILWRADFKVGNVYIEYFGLTGQKNYDIKTKSKIEYAKQYKMELIELYPSDISSEIFKDKLKTGLSKT